jgi:hypothetical protein
VARLLAIHGGGPQSREGLETRGERREEVERERERECGGGGGAREGGGSQARAHVIAEAPH